MTDAAGTPQRIINVGVLLTGLLIAVMALAALAPGGCRESYRGFVPGTPNTNWVDCRTAVGSRPLARRPVADNGAQLPEHLRNQALVVPAAIGAASLLTAVATRRLRASMPLLLGVAAAAGLLTGTWLSGPHHFGQPGPETATQQPPSG